MRTLIVIIAVVAGLLVPAGEASGQPGRMGLNGLTVGDDGSVPDQAAVHALAHRRRRRVDGPSHQ